MKIMKDFLPNSDHYGYHWNDDHIHADDCGSVSLGIIEACTEDIPDQPCDEEEGSPTSNC
jgi:hypothetical protein